MKLLLKKGYMIHPPGTVVDFPASVAELLIHRGIAEEAKAEKPKQDKSQAHRKYRNK